MEEERSNISLKEEIKKLLELQNKDLKLKALYEDKAAHPQRLAELKTAFEGKGADLEAAKEELKQLQADIKKIELEVESKKQDILKHSNQLFEMKSNEEYKAMEKEIQHEKEENVQKEDVILEEMLKVDEIKEKIAKLEEEYAKDQEELKQKEKDVEERLKNIEVEIKQLEDERKNCAVRIQEDVLSKYERVLKNKPDMAVVPVENFICMGCHMSLIHQTFADVKRCTEVVTCENCSRILYLPDDLAAES